MNRHRRKKLQMAASWLCCIKVVHIYYIRTADLRTGPQVLSVTSQASWSSPSCWLCCAIFRNLGKSQLILSVLIPLSTCSLHQITVYQVNNHILFRIMSSMWSLNILHVELKSREKSCEFKFCKDSYHQKLNRKEEKSKKNTYLLKALANSRKIRLEQERYEKSSKIWKKLQNDKEKTQLHCHSLRTLV